MGNILTGRRYAKRLNIKQNTSGIVAGVPSIRDLQQGIPVFMKTPKGLTMYVRAGHQLYSTNISKHSGSSEVSYLPRTPDYDSDWVAVLNTQTTGTHSLGVIPGIQQIWFSDDDGVTAHRLYSSNTNSYTLELTTTEWQITSSTNYGSLCLTGTTLTHLDYTGYKVKVLLWK